MNRRTFTPTAPKTPGVHDEAVRPHRCARHGEDIDLRQLQERGFDVVEEAATAVIADGRAAGHPEPWIRADLVEVPAGEVVDRVALIEQTMARLSA